MYNGLDIKEQIRDRKAKYCRYLDTKNFDAWESIFAPEAQITFYGPSGEILLDKTIADLSLLTRELFANTKTIH